MNQDLTLNLAVFALRTVTGILFLFQGYDKTFHVKADGIISSFETEVTKKFFSRGFLKATTYLSSYIEMIAGLMLLAGFGREIALSILAVEMIFVTVAFSLIKPMWDMQFFFPRFVFIITLLILPEEWDRFSLDHLLKLF
ncbi:MAG: DoxX family membrane protein [Bacteroidetes bacterium]|nr:DoxX family membrane protein [Bacteroidota bacterium]